MLRLPSVAKTAFDIRPINWAGLSRRYMNNGELEVLIALARQVDARRVMEIGCNEGRTAKALLDNVPTLMSYRGIDVLPGYQFARLIQKNEVPQHPGWMAKHDPRFELTLSPQGSFDVIKEAWYVSQYDLVFVDGDHSRRAVINDTTLALSAVRPGGLIVWHDYHDRDTVDVRDVLHDLYDSGLPIAHIENTWFAYMQVAGG